MQMKNTLARLANSNVAWPVFKMLRKLERKLAALCDYVERQRGAGATRDLKTSVIHQSFPDLTVKNGPFAGLRYPSAAATGSALLPKLLGSYESEAAPFLRSAAERDFSDIVDVGCAEGYYAVGLALMFPKARIHAYDVDAGARSMCAKMAETNGVRDRLTLGGWCDAAMLASLPPDARAFIVADCEGYEKNLFSKEAAPTLARHDLLIECHDYQDPEITPSIRDAFSATHDIMEAASVPDFRKAVEISFPELDGYDPISREFIVAEARGAPQCWLFLQSKSSRCEDPRS